MSGVDPNALLPSKRSIRNEILILLAMCMLAFLALGMVVLIKASPDHDIPVTNFLKGYFFVPEERPLVLGTVTLGTPIEDVHKRYVNAVKSLTPNGSLTLAFLDGEDKYIVWYSKDGPRRVAYKVRQTQILRGVNENDFIATYTERYGPPSLASCNKRVVDGLRDCQFRWWIPKGGRLDIHSRQDPRLAVPVLKVTSQITDTRLEGQLQRTAQHLNAAPAPKLAN